MCWGQPEKKPGTLYPWEGFGEEDVATASASQVTLHAPLIRHNPGNVWLAEGGGDRLTEGVIAAEPRHCVYGCVGTIQIK